MPRRRQSMGKPGRAAGLLLRLPSVSCVFVWMMVVRDKCALRHGSSSVCNIKRHSRANSNGEGGGRKGTGTRTIVYLLPEQGQEQAGDLFVWHGQYCPGCSQIWTAAGKIKGKNSQISKATISVCPAKVVDRGSRSFFFRAKITYCERETSSDDSKYSARIVVSKPSQSQLNSVVALLGIF